MKQVMRCNHCDRIADDFDRICGAFTHSELPFGDRYVCPTCVGLVIKDFHIKKEEFQRYGGDCDLVAG